MTQTKLEAAFTFTKEQHAALFERFANAFLLPDFPELEGIGGKKDKGLDARLVSQDDALLLAVP